jgi:hypothetical protein
MAGQHAKKMAHHAAKVKKTKVHTAKHPKKPKTK